MPIETVAWSAEVRTVGDFEFEPEACRRPAPPPAQSTRDKTHEGPDSAPGGAAARVRSPDPVGERATERLVLAQELAGHRPVAGLLGLDEALVGLVAEAGKMLGAGLQEGRARRSPLAQGLDLGDLDVVVALTLDARSLLESVTQLTWGTRGASETQGRGVGGRLGAKKHTDGG